MSESETLIYDLLHSLLKQIPSAEKALVAGMTKWEMTELLRLNSTTVYDAYQDLSVLFDSLIFIASDFQLRLKAEDIWKQQLEVFRSRLQPAVADLEAACIAENITIKEFVDKFSKY